MLKVNIPETAGRLVKGIDPEDTPDNLFELCEAFLIEMMECMREAARAQEPQIVFNPVRRSGEQYIWEFYVNDLVKQNNPNQINWHGQNTSQWLYAGCVLLQNKRVSRHH